MPFTLTSWALAQSGTFNNDIVGSLLLQATESTTVEWPHQDSSRLPLELDFYSAINLNALAKLRALAPPDNTSSPRNKPSCVHDLQDFIHGESDWNDDASPSLDDAHILAQNGEPSNTFTFSNRKRHTKSSTLALVSVPNPTQLVATTDASEMPCTKQELEFQEKDTSSGLKDTNVQQTSLQLSDWRVSVNMGSYMWMTEWRHDICQVLPNEQDGPLALILSPMSVNTSYKNPAMVCGELAKDLMNRLHLKRPLIEKATTLRLLQMRHLQVYDAWILALTEAGKHGAIVFF